MIQLSIKAAKEGFFDSAVVLRAVSDADRRSLSKAGAFVRQRARSSMRKVPKGRSNSGRGRKRKTVSDPGKPPLRHEGGLHRFLFFSWDNATLSVVIGPAKYRKGEAPNLLEQGGMITRTTKRRGPRTMTYRPRPFMLPALKAEAHNFPGLWQNSLVS